MSFDRRTRQQRANDDAVARYLGRLQGDVMRVFWEHDSATIREACELLAPPRRLAYTTVLTVVTRLWSRGLLLREQEGRGHRYTAAKTREQFLGELSDELIDRLLGDFGEIGVARLGDRLGRLEPEQRRRLRRMARGMKS